MSSDSVLCVYVWPDVNNSKLIIVKPDISYSQRFPLNQINLISITSPHTCDVYDDIDAVAHCVVMDVVSQEGSSCEETSSVSDGSVQRYGTGSESAHAACV